MNQLLSHSPSAESPACCKDGKIAALEELKAKVAKSKELLQKKEGRRSCSCMGVCVCVLSPFFGCCSVSIGKDVFAGVLFEQWHGKTEGPMTVEGLGLGPSLWRSVGKKREKGRNCCSYRNCAPKVLGVSRKGE